MRGDVSLAQSRNVRRYRAKLISFRVSLHTHSELCLELLNPLLLRLQRASRLQSKAKKGGEVDVTAGNSFLTESDTAHHVP